MISFLEHQKEEEEAADQEEEEIDDDVVEEYDIDESQREYEQTVVDGFLEGVATWQEQRGRGQGQAADQPEEEERKRRIDEAKEEKIMAAYRRIKGSGKEEECKKAAETERKRQDAFAAWRDSRATFRDRRPNAGLNKVATGNDKAPASEVVEQANYKRTKEVERVGRGGGWRRDLNEMRPRRLLTGLMMPPKSPCLLRCSLATERTRSRIRNPIQRWQNSKWHYKTSRS